MFYWLNQSRVIYILSNLLVLPATFIPFIDFLSNISFIIAFIFFVKSNALLLLLLCLVFIAKNNSNYRFNILLKQKGKEISKSDYECVYLYGWCTLLRYILVGLASYQVVQLFK